MATLPAPEHFPDSDAVREHYLHHENDPDDAGYRAFLDKLVAPLARQLAPRLQGLDYGCGPGPAGAAMLREAGHKVAEYDPFFRPDQRALQGTYDFILCAEVVEHFHRPGEEFDRLDALLEPGGWLGIMTCFQTDDAGFAGWHYRRDPSRVVFYREETLRQIARDREWECRIPAKDVALMRKPQ